MRKMRTAEEMLAYYCENRGPEGKKGLFDYKPNDNLEDYKRAEMFLESDEYVVTFFWGYIYIHGNSNGNKVDLFIDK